MGLSELGWDRYFEEGFQAQESPGSCAGRVVAARSGRYALIGAGGMKKAGLSGKLRSSLTRKNRYPVVGDWVVYREKDGREEVSIDAVLPRKSSFVRKLPISGGRKLKNGAVSGGIIEEQVICANIDTAFIVTGLDDDFDIHRIERYVTLVYNSGSTPVLLLNKADMCRSVSSYLQEVKKIALDVPVHALSAVSGTGMEIFALYLRPGKTAVFLGSSGVGKSTMINRLLGEERQKTNRTSTATGKGRHTTVASELILHPNGSMIIDTPGLRELQLWGSLEALNRSYRDIYELSLQCKYKNCVHETEPHCAVKQAIRDGTISQERLESYRKQLAELTKLDRQKTGYEKSLSRKEKLRAKQKAFK